MKRKIFFLFFATILIACGQAGTATAAEDIVGLKIGMAPEEARLVLGRIDPKLNIVESKTGNWKLLTMDARNATERIVLMFTETQPKAWFIGRSIIFEKGKGPTRESMARDIIVKYGTPTKTEEYRTKTLWVWATSPPKPNLAPDSFRLRGCVWGAFDQAKWPTPFVFSSQQSDDFIYLRSVSEECDKLIEATIFSTTGENPKIASTLVIAITNFALPRADPKNPANVAAVNQQRQIEEAQKNKRPKL